MNRFLTWLRSFGTFVYVRGNMNVLVAGDRNSAEYSGGRSTRPMLLQSPAAPAARTARPPLQIHMASTRRERILEPRGNEDAIRASWKATIRSLEAQQNEGGKK